MSKQNNKITAEEITFVLSSLKNLDERSIASIALAIEIELKLNYNLLKRCRKLVLLKGGKIDA